VTGKSRHMQKGLSVDDGPFFFKGDDPDLAGVAPDSSRPLFSCLFYVTIFRSALYSHFSQWEFP